MLKKNFIIIFLIFCLTLICVSYRLAAASDRFSEKKDEEFLYQIDLDTGFNLISAGSNNVNNMFFSLDNRIKKNKIGVRYLNETQVLRSQNKEAKIDEVEHFSNLTISNTENKFLHSVLETSYFTSKTRGIDYRIDIGAGVNLEAPKWCKNQILLCTRTELPVDKNSSKAAFIKFSNQTELQITKNIVLNNSAQFNKQINDAKNWQTSTNTRLKMMLNEIFSLKFGFKWDFDNIGYKDAKHNRQIYCRLGVTFTN